MGFGIALHGIHKFVLPWFWLAASRLVNPQGRTHLDRTPAQKSFLQRQYSTYETCIQITMLVLHHFPQKFQKAFSPKQYYLKFKKKKSSHQTSVSTTKAHLQSVLVFSNKTVYLGLNPGSSLHTHPAPKPRH